MNSDREGGLGSPQVLEGIGVPVSGPEEDYVELDTRYCGITSILGACGAEVTSWDVMTAWKYNQGEHHDDEQWAEIRATHPRPRPIRIRVVAYIEPVTDEEADAWWIARQWP